MLSIRSSKIIPMLILLVGFLCAGGMSDKDAVVSENQEVLQGSDTTKLEKYERKVIIKAKVGKGPGELGVIGEGPMPKELALWDGSMEGPKGIAIDSEGYIYILDALNKRVLKFSQEGTYIRAINLDNFNNELSGNLENRLFIDSEGNFFIKESVIELGQKIRCKYTYDENGELLGRMKDMPSSAGNMERKSVSSTISKFTVINASKDTVVNYYIADSAINRNYTITVYLPKREGWKYMITPYSFLGFDKKGNSYIKIDAFEETFNLLPEERTTYVRKEEEMVLKYNEVGKLVAIIREICSGRGHEMWALGSDGTLYLMKYAFKTIITDELPEWLKDSDIPEEAKKHWRCRYTAPEGFVYVVKFTKVEEK